MIYRAGTYILPSGKTLYANDGIIGMDRELALYTGYDAKGPPISKEECWDESDEYETSRVLTIEDRKEIAKEMVRRWTAWGGL